MSPDVLKAVMTLAAAIVAVMGVTQGHLWNRLRHTESTVRQLWNDREEDAVKKRKLGDHVDRLEHHIWNEKPPPPPERPEGL